MAANTQPIYIKAPRVEQVKLTTGSGTYDGSAATQLFVAGVDGSRIESIRVAPVASTVQSKLLIYIKEGAVFTLFQDWPLSAVSPTNTNSVGIPGIPMGINIPTGAEIWVQLTVNGSWDVTCLGGDY